MSITLRYLGTLSGVGVEAVKGLPRHQYVTARASWLGQVDFLHDEHSVLHVAVEKLYLKSYPSHRPDLTPVTGYTRIPAASDKDIKYF